MIFFIAVNDLKKYDSKKSEEYVASKFQTLILHVRLDKEMNDYRQTFPALIRKCQSQIILH